MKKVLLIPFFTFYYLLNAQTVDDAFRYLQPIEGGGVSSKSLGFSNSTFGDDISGVFGNPASIGLLKRNEFSSGFAFKTASNESDFLNSKKSQDYSASKLDHIAFVIPFPVNQGSFVVGLGFARYNDFDELSKGSSFNANSSYVEGIDQFDPNVVLTAGNKNSDIGIRKQKSLYFEYAYEAYLIDPRETSLNSGLYKYNSAAIGQSQQEYKNITSGDLYSYTAAVSVEVAPQVFVGGSLNVISGTQNSSFSWKETADLNYYYNHPELFVKIDDKQKSFHHLTFEETYGDQVAGYSLKLGLLAKVNEFVKIGGTIYFPTYLSVTSKYSYDLVGYFIDPITSVISSHAAEEKYTDEVTYEINGPMTFEGNIGFLYFPFQCEFGMISTSWKNTSFVENDQIDYLPDENEKFKFETKRTYNFKFGLQYSIPEINSNLKGGIHTFSGFKSSSNKIDYLYSLGIEFVPDESYSINCGYTLSDINTNYNAYQPFGKPLITYSEKSLISNFVISAGFKF